MGPNTRMSLYGQYANDGIDPLSIGRDVTCELVGAANFVYPLAKRQQRKARIVGADLQHVENTLKVPLASKICRAEVTGAIPLPILILCPSFDPFVPLDHHFHEGVNVHCHFIYKPPGIPVAKSCGSTLRQVLATLLRIRVPLRRFELGVFHDPSASSVIHPLWRLLATPSGARK